MCANAMVDIETTKSFRGACFSPFVRAYVAELNAHGIDQDTFVGFIDGLNEAFVANPVLEAINIASAVVSMTVPLPDVQYVFGGISIGAALAGRATSYARTKTYLKAVNTNLFNPAGLNVSVMNTKKMMEELGCGESTLNLPPLDTFADIDEGALAEPVDQDQSTGKTHPDDPRMRRIRALEGYVMPLNFDMPPPAVSRDNFLKRMGDAHVNWLSRRQQKNLTKKREKAIAKDLEKEQKAEEKRIGVKQEVAKLEREFANEQIRFETEMNSEKATSDPKEGDRAIEDFEKQTSKISKQIDKEKSKLEEQAEKREQDADKELRKKEEKEEKIARKIRWVVISAWNGEEDDSDLSKVSSESSVI